MMHDIVARLDAIAAKLDRLVEAMVDKPARSVAKSKEYERRLAEFWARIGDDRRFPGLRARIQKSEGFTVALANALLDTGDMVAVAHYLTKDRALVMKLSSMEEPAMRQEMKCIEHRIGLAVAKP